MDGGIQFVSGISPIGAVIPVIPYFLVQGQTAFVASAIACGAALFVIGALISIFTGRNMVYSGIRMVGIGAGNLRDYIPRRQAASGVTVG